MSLPTPETSGREAPPCAVCGSDRLETFRDRLRDREGPSSETFRIVECLACGHRYLHPRPTRDEIGRYYRQGYAPFRDSKEGWKGRLLAWRARGWARRVARWTPQEGEVLEIGSASGRLLDALRERGFSTTGLEPTPRAAAIAEERGHRVVVAPAEEAEWEPETFDTVVMMHVMEHLHEPAAVLAGLRRALRPRGRLFLTLPNVDSWVVRVFGRHYFWEVPRHLQFFSPESLRRLLDREGFAIEHLRWEHLPAEWVRGVSYALGGPGNWAGKVFAVENPLWLALAGPLEIAAAASGAGGRMTVVAKKK